MSDPEGIIAKIKKCLQLAENALTEGEAAAAAAAAAKLMQAHNISQEMLAEQSGIPVSEHYERRLLFPTKRIPSWFASLLVEVGKSVGVGIFSVIKSGIYGFGTPEDLDAVSLMGNYLKIEIESLCKAACARHSFDRSHGRIYANNFKMGAREVVVARLRESRSKMLEEAKDYASEYAVARVTNKLARVREAGGFDRMTRRKAITYRHDTAGREAGRRAGAKISLDAPTNRIR